MSIRELSLTARHADHLQNQAVSASQSRTAEEAGTKSEAPSEAEDRVEISEAGKRALDGAFTNAELEFARNALSNTPPMTAERLGEIHSRLQSGFYASDEAQQVIATRLAAALLAGDL